MTTQQARAELAALRDQGRLNYTETSNGRIQINFPLNGVDFRYKPHSSPDTRSYGLDPRMAVATTRLAEWASSQGITEISHLGFAGRSPTDRHGQGRALDIAGFHGVNPQTGQRFSYDVLRDWGNAPSQGSGYRLDPNTHKGRLFLDAYNFLTTQFRDTNGRSQIGDRSYVLHPDHPSPDLRSTHQNHFHIEVPPL
jgi:hypothetical protein